MDPSEQVLNEPTNKHDHIQCCKRQANFGFHGAGGQQDHREDKDQGENEDGFLVLVQAPFGSRFPRWSGWIEGRTLHTQIIRFAFRSFRTIAVYSERGKALSRGCVKGQRLRIWLVRERYSLTPTLGVLWRSCAHAEAPSNESPQCSCDFEAQHPFFI